jgi:hypothetical protein
MTVQKRRRVINKRRRRVEDVDVEEVEDVRGIVKDLFTGFIRKSLWRTLYKSPKLILRALSLLPFSLAFGDFSFRVFLLSSIAPKSKLCPHSIK